MPIIDLMELLKEKAAIETSANAWLGGDKFHVRARSRTSSTQAQHDHIRTAARLHRSQTVEKNRLLSCFGRHLWVPKGLALLLPALAA